jgi:cob(I)alamin adenosyltransferase
VTLNVGTGDKGITSLLSGERVPKSHIRVEACGELDELASVLGALAASLSSRQAQTRAEISWIQEELLHIGAWVATTPGSSGPSSSVPGTVQAPSAGPVEALENATEAMEKDLPPLQGFLLPGGHPSAAWAHVARTVCRRAERRAAGVPSPEALPFLNRLSTYLYTLARSCNRLHEVPETQWKP